MSSSWPPPSPARPPAPPTRPFDDGRLPAAAWVATVGVALVLAAASVLVVGSWNRIRPEIKLAGLVAANVVVATAAGALRRPSPIVARALAHLAAMLAVPSGVAVVAAAHGTWPGAILAGGSLGVVACVAQSRRWRAPLLVPAAEAAAVVALAGVAALGQVPLGVMVASVAVALAACRRDAGAVRVASVGALVPFLAVLGALGVGPGTAERLGARGDVLAWAGPVAGAAAALALGVVAGRRRLVPVAAASMLAAASGVVVALAQLRADRSVSVGFAGAALLVIAMLESGLAGQVWRDTVGSLGAGGRFVAPVAAVVGLAAIPSDSMGQPNAGFAWAALAWAAAALVFLPRSPADRASMPWALASALRIGGAVAAAGGVAALAARPLGALIVLTPAAVVLGPWRVVRWGERVALAVLATALTSSTASDTADGRSLVAALLGAALCLVLAWPAWLGVAATPSSWRWHRSPLVVTLAACAGLCAGSAWPQARWGWVVGVAAVSLAFCAARHWSLAVASVPWLAAAVSEALGMSSLQAAVAALVAGVALTGLSATVAGDRRLDAAAWSTALVAFAASLGTDGTTLVTLAVALLGAQAAVVGLQRGSAPLTAAGGATTSFALTSLPFTSGIAARAVAALAARGITPVDLAIAFVASVFLAGGWWLRRTGQPLGSWPAYAPGLIVAGSHLVTSQIATGQVGRVAVAMGLGIVAVAIGGLRRLSAPLVLGAALVASSGVSASGRQLASLPVWMWLAAGGVGLLAVALVIERQAPDADDAEPAAAAGRLRAVCQRFE